MKASFKILGLIVVLFLSGNSYAEEKSKTVKRSFNVSPSTLIEIENKFGKIHVNTWDKNEVNVQVEIKAEGRDPDGILEKIEIQFKDDDINSYLGMVTLLKEFHEKKSSFQINYTIDLPKSNKVSLTNKFGDVYLSDLNNDATLNVQYGNLKAGKLNGTVELDLQFGSAMNQIAYVKNGRIQVKYSKLTVDSAGPLDIDSQFSDVLGTTFSQTNLEMKYGKFIVGKVGKIVGSQSFSEFNVQRLTDNLDIEVKHNQVYVGSIDERVKKIVVDGQFSKIELGVGAAYSAKFIMDFQFSDLKYEGPDITFRKRIREPTKNYYEGYIGKENADASILIHSKYGDLKLNVKE